MNWGYSETNALRVKILYLTYLFDLPTTILTVINLSQWNRNIKCKSSVIQTILSLYYQPSNKTLQITNLYFKIYLDILYLVSTTRKTGS